MSRELLQQALNAFEFNLPVIEDFGSKEQLTDCHKVITKLYEELAKPDHNFDTPESHIVKWSMPVDPNNFGEPLAQPEQEPKLTDAGAETNISRGLVPKGSGVVTLNQVGMRVDLKDASPRKPWVGLTDDEIDKAWEWAQKSSPYGVTRIEVFAKRIETQLRKNNAV
jgi:hypothetical protein